MRHEEIHRAMSKGARGYDLMHDVMTNTSFLLALLLTYM